MTQSVASRLRALRKFIWDREPLIANERQTIHLRPEIGDLIAEVEEIAKEMRETAMRKAPVSRVMNPISAADAWAWADRLASEGK